MNLSDCSLFLCLCYFHYNVFFSEHPGLTERRNRTEQLILSCSQIRMTTKNTAFRCNYCL